MFWPPGFLFVVDCVCVKRNRVVLYAAPVAFAPPYRSAASNPLQACKCVAVLSRQIRKAVAVFLSLGPCGAHPWVVLVALTCASAASDAEQGKAQEKEVATALRILANETRTPFTDWTWHEYQLPRCSSKDLSLGAHPGVASLPKAILPTAASCRCPCCLLLCFGCGLFLAVHYYCTTRDFCISTHCWRYNSIFGCKTPRYSLISFRLCCAVVAEHGHGLFLRARGRALPHGELGAERPRSAWRGQGRQPLPLR